jgi:glycine/D-amino acid oxidase-like deaminating enzyme
VSAPLTEAIDVDVAVVGGGYTGLWTALALRERDPSLSVALLEAREIGDGPSGRNGGFLHGYWSSLPTLRQVLGDGAALQLAHASARIVPAVRAFCESRGEDVWFREGGMLEVSAGESEDSEIEHAFEAVRALGVEEEATLLDTAGCDAGATRLASAAVSSSATVRRCSRRAWCVRSGERRSRAVSGCSSTRRPRPSVRARRRCSRRHGASSGRARWCSR